MPLFSFRFRNAPSLAFPLGCLMCAAGTAARAEEAGPISLGTPATPQLTLGTRPSSSIAASLRPQISATRSASGRSLLMASPTPATATNVDQNASQSMAPARAVANGIATPVVSATEKSATRSNPAYGVVLSNNAAPQTLISPPKRVKVKAKSRFVASRVSRRDETDAALSATPMAIQTPALAVLPPVAPPPAAPSPRDRMARLPSRGGSVRGRAPVELNSGAPETAAISDSQRLLLAQLDADLGRAQRRLNRAETRLSEGQRQLGAATGVLRSAMFDTGDDGRGLHPFVRVAQRYMGTPYVWGGESALGFDCSGFIMRVMRDLGYRALPHSAAEQFNYGVPVARELLKPGDIVFFANTYKPGVSHVGIYLGKSRFIHAANSNVGTIVSGLNEPKWVRHYAGARRLIRVKS